MSSTIVAQPESSVAGVRGETWIACVWAVVLGILSGLACAAVRLGFRYLQWIFVQSTSSLPASATMLPDWRRMLTPALGALCATGVLWAVRRWSSAAPFEEYVEAIRFDNGRISFASTFWRTISSAFSVATGAAIGREGSMIQFATAVTSWVGQRSPFAEISLARQVSYGAAAAVSAAYQAPIAGVLFVMEIVLGRWAWSDFPQLFLASVAGWSISGLILGYGPLYPLHQTFSFSYRDLWVPPLVAVLGLAAPLYHQLLRSFRFARKWPLALVWAGALVGLLSLRIPATWGNGDVALLHTLQGASFVEASWILVSRLAATSFCVGTGTVGGVFTPTLFTGAALGLLIGYMLHLPHPILFAVIGMSALIAAVTHAPWMAAFMAAELTGQWMLFPVLLLGNLFACAIARHLSSHSLYAVATPEPVE